MAPRVFNLGTRWWCLVMFTLRPLCHREKNRCACRLEASMGTSETRKTLPLLAAVLNELSRNVLCGSVAFLTFRSLRLRQTSVSCYGNIPSQWNQRIGKVISASWNRTAVRKACLLHAFVAKIKKKGT